MSREFKIKIGLILSFGFFLTLFLIVPKQVQAEQTMWYCVVDSKACTETNSKYTDAITCAANVLQYIDGGVNKIKTTGECYPSPDSCQKNDYYCKTTTTTPSGSGGTGGTTTGGTNTPTSKEDTTWNATFGNFLTGNTTPTASNCPASGTYESGILKGIKCNQPVTGLDEVVAIVKNIATSFLLPLVGTLFIIMFIIGGLQYITSAGNDEKMKAGKKTLTAAIIGFVIVVLSYTIIKIVISIMGGGVS